MSINLDHIVLILHYKFSVVGNPIFFLYLQILMMKVNDLLKNAKQAFADFQPHDPFF